MVARTCCASSPVVPIAPMVAMAIISSIAIVFVWDHIDVAYFIAQRDKCFEDLVPL